MSTHHADTRPQGRPPGRRPDPRPREGVLEVEIVFAEPTPEQLAAERRLCDSLLETIARRSGD